MIEKIPVSELDNNRIIDFIISLLSTLTEYYQGTILLLIIVGWIFIPAYTHRLTRARERVSLINKNIENIELIFEDMNELATEQFKLDIQDNTIYFKLIHCNQKLTLYCNRMTEIDAKFTYPKEHISSIRQYTTNDKIISKHGEYTMHRLAYEQMELLKLYPQRH